MSTIATHSPPAPKILKEDQVSKMTKLHAFKLLRKLAGTSRQLPKRYLVGPFTRFKVKKPIIASDGFGDVRKGRYKGMDVAVKTIRTSQWSDIKAMHKVHRVVRCPVLNE